MNGLEDQILSILEERRGAASKEELLERTGVEPQSLYAAVGKLQSQGRVNTLEELGASPWYAVELTQ